MLETMDNPDPDLQPLDGLIEVLGPDFDIEALRRVQALDPQGASGLMPQLLQCYATVMQQQAAALQQGVLRADGELVARAAHAARSSSLYIGAEGFAQACLELERMAHDGSASGELWRDRGAALADWALALRGRALLGVDVLQGASLAGAMGDPAPAS